MIIIDEGHLLGENKRYVINEMFTEELRYLMKINSGKIILLSAVLPNSAEISKWITNDENQIAKSDWRPSSQRFGILEFTGTSVNLEWQGEQPSYNTSFIKIVNNKKEAIALSAIKLSSIGSVLIYIAIAKWIPSQAREIYNLLKKHGVPDEDWSDDYDWQKFELCCIENNQEDILQYARKGIMCHSNKLPSEVRFCMERILRKGKAKYILSTSTLAQGVNLGVSVVIFFHVFNPNKISNKDFWNIAGRAGRAFVDTEGKILYAIDKTGKYIDWHRRLANEYFNHNNLESAKSGLLTQIIRIQNIAECCDIDFEHLLELITENNFSQIPNDKKQADSIIDFFDWIDDSLLALNLAYGSIETEESNWIDDHFRESLAYIQAEDEGDDIIQILKARSTAVKRLAGDPRQWKSFASSGIPLMSIAKIDELIDEISDIVSGYLNSNKQIEDKNNFLKNIERIINQLPSSHFRHSFTQNELDSVRQLWLSGNSLKGIPIGDKIANEYFSFTIPWVLNAISKKYKQQENEEAGIVFEEFGVLCELGLPSFWAAKIYLSGIRSRQAATELSLVIKEEFAIKSLNEISEIIIRNKEKLKGRNDCSENTLRWIEILAKDQTSVKKSLPRIVDFIFSTENLKIVSSILYCKSYSGSCFLCSPDYKDKIEVTINDDFPFDKVCDIPGIYFEWEDDVWKMKNKNPHYQLN